MESDVEKRELTESEVIDRQVEEIMADGDSGEGDKKRKRKRKKKARSGDKPSLKERWKGYSRKRKIITVVAVLAVAALVLSRCGKGGDGPAAMPVNVMSLTRQPIKEKLSVSGPISGTDSVDVVSNIHAEIITMNVKEGDKVTKDQVLAVLDKTDLERDLQVAQNAYDLAVVNKQEKDKSEALGYEKATQDLRKAQADYNRNSALYAAGDISQVEMEQAANALEDAKRQVEGYNVVNGRGAADASYELQVQNAAIDLEKKKEELENAEIKSTIDGTVVRVNSKVGQFADKVEDDKPIFSIENLDQLEMEIKISEYSIGKVQVGQKAVISADILDGETVEGEIIKISPTGEEKGGGSTERVIPTTIRIDGTDSKLIAGITAKAEILIRESEDAFVVPVTALIDDGEASYIAVVEEQKVRRIPVTLGVDGDVNVEVIPADGSELTEGMQVILNPGPMTVDGALVTVMPQM
ncbi:MAG: efflux RND transporter periplasmic adaptor subunit [Enterocloster asparagiformis]|nr:efflux RND transporter periplasmic adaptor subunit [Enterocloster asparagiformis]